LLNLKKLIKVRRLSGRLIWKIIVLRN
jgi:hypothetical protein